MRLAAVLAFYDEPVNFLTRLVASLGFCDELIAYDGAWAEFPGGKTESPPEQCEAILATAAEIGLQATLRAPDAIWESQVAKRSALYQEGAERAEWIFVIDGDEWVEQERGIKDALSRLQYDVAQVENHHTQPTGTIRMRNLMRTPRRLFRTEHGLLVTETHNGIRRASDGAWLAGPRRVEKEPCAFLGAHLKMCHQAWSRGERRNEYSRRYYQARARKRIEVFS